MARKGGVRATLIEGLVVHSIRIDGLLDAGGIRAISEASRRGTSVDASWLRERGCIPEGCQRERGTSGHVEAAGIPPGCESMTHQRGVCDASLMAAMPPASTHQLCRNVPMGGSIHVEKRICAHQRMAKRRESEQLGRRVGLVRGARDVIELCR